MQDALDLLALQRAHQLAVIASDGRLVGLLDWRDVITAYRRRIAELRA